MPQEISSPLMTVEEAARQLGIKKPWLYSMIQYQECPAYYFGRSVRVKLPEVQEWLESRKGASN